MRAHDDRGAQGAPVDRDHQPAGGLGPAVGRARRPDQVEADGRRGPPVDFRVLGKNKGRRAPRRPDKARKADRDDGDQKEPAVVMDAVVSQALPNAMFEVEVEGGHKLIAYAAGRMRRYFIRITPGDRIRVELSPYDLTRGRIVYRYRD